MTVIGFTKVGQLLTTFLAGFFNMRTEQHTLRRARIYGQRDAYVDFDMVTYKVTMRETMSSDPTSSSFSQRTVSGLISVAKTMPY